MSRRLLWVIPIIVVVLSAILIRNVVRAHRAEQRIRTAATDAANQSALLQYSKSLTPGLTRKNVEAYLRARGTSFIQRCCMEERDAFSDLVKVGEGEKPWYCSSWTVYVAFVFAASEPVSLSSRPSDSDVLKRVELTSNGEGCL
jgi:hypothetical protein